MTTTESQTLASKSFTSKLMPSHARIESATTRFYLNLNYSMQAPDPIFLGSLVAMLLTVGLQLVMAVMEVFHA